MKILHLTGVFKIIKKLNQTLQIVLLQLLTNFLCGKYLRALVRIVINGSMEQQQEEQPQDQQQPLAEAEAERQRVAVDNNDDQGYEQMDWAEDTDASEDDDDDEEEEDNDNVDDDDDADDTDVDMDDMFSDGYSSDSILASNFVLQYIQYRDFVESLGRKMEEYRFQPWRLTKVNYKLQNPSVKSYPLARSGHRIICSDSHLYSLGGYNPNIPRYAVNESCQLFQELWSFNFSTKQWKLMLNGESAPDMPKELASNALAIHNNVLISHGGTGYPFGDTCSNDCYVYTTGNKPLVTCLKVTGDLPTALYGPGIVIHKDYLYTIGGTTGFDYSCDVYRLNMVTRVWENVYICRPEMRDDPEGRYRHEVVYDGNHIYVLGGGTSNSVYDLQRLPAFNLHTNRWDYFDTLPDRTVAASAATVNAAGFPKPRKCFSCVQNVNLNGDVEAFISGGMQGEFTNYFADIWKLNMRTKQWTCIQTATLPKPLYFHSAAATSTGCMYIFGGIEYSKKDMRRRNDLFKMWMTIPKLSEICWDAITYYSVYMNRHDRQKLLSAGVPDRFVERLGSLNQEFKVHENIHDFLKH